MATCQPAGNRKRHRPTLAPPATFAHARSAIELLAIHEAAAGPADPALEFCRERLAWPADRLNPSPLLDGSDLIRHGLDPGPHFASLLEQARDAQLEGEIQTRDEALALIDRLRACNKRYHKTARTSLERMDMTHALLLLAQQSTMPQFNGMYWLQFLSRICHILGAIILVGGLFYIRFVISPVDTPPGTGPVDQLFGGRRAAWAKWVGIATALLLITGLFNYYMVTKQYEQMASSYHMVAGIKMLTAFVVFLLAALLAGRTAVADTLREKWSMWLAVCLGIAIFAVILGSFLRSYPRTIKVDVPAPPKLSAAAQPAAQPIVELSITGPRSRMVGENAEFRISVKNLRHVAATNVELTFHCDSAMTPTKATPDLQLLENGDLQLKIAKLEPGELRNVAMEVKCQIENDHAGASVTLKSDGDKTFPMAETFLEVLPFAKNAVAKSAGG